jgi:molybdopterin converting factor subunit 1
MKYSIKAFGIAREIFGTSLLTVELEGDVTVGLMKTHLVGQYPKLAGLKSLFIAVNQEYATDEVRLRDSDEIALIPPVSGG